MIFAPKQRERNQTKKKHTNEYPAIQTLFFPTLKQIQQYTTTHFFETTN